MQLKSIVLLLLATFSRNCASTVSRLARRTSGARATLANKLDPNFWPTRGRRSSGQFDLHLAARQIPPEEIDPFFANRGRSVDAVILRVDPQWIKANTEFFGKELNPEFPANRVRLLDYLNSKEAGQFYGNRGRSENEESSKVTSTNSDLFYANRGRNADDEYSFWENEGRSAATIGPFWANKGRSTEYTNARTNDNDGTFWANRGRSISIIEPLFADQDLFDDNPSSTRTAIPIMHNVFDGNKQTLSNDEGNKHLEGASNRAIQKEDLRSIVKKWWNLPPRLQRSPLYADEPKYVILPRASRPSMAKDDKDTFWVARGRRSQPDNLWRNGRASKGSSRALDHLKEQFWPSRGKKSSGHGEKRPTTSA